MSYAINLDIYQGPLDLLLELVSKRRVDVSEITISTITEEFLQAVVTAPEFDLEVASSFLVMVSTLLELKSIKLLPGRDTTDPELAALLEERDHLIHKLIEYSTFKRAAAHLSDLASHNRGYFSRTAPLPEELKPESIPPLEISLRRLGAAAAKAIGPKPPKPKVDTSHLAPIRISVGDMVSVMSDQLRGNGRTTFRQLCESTRDRIEIIVRFLALLEMFKRQSVDLRQDAPFGDIVVSWQPAADG